jgi:nicotinamidase-related amidase
LPSGKHRKAGGIASDHSEVALLVIDMISDFRFEEAPQMLRRIAPVARKIAALKERARAAGIPVIYVNDNFGRWRSDLAGLVAYCSAPYQPGAKVVRLVAPAKQDYFILKPRHSGFYASALETLLEHMGVHRLILTGISSHQCVLFTANDAYVREYELKIPRDCIAAPAAPQTRLALQYFDTVLGADTRPSDRFRQWARRRAKGTPPSHRSRQ